jgi:hypothetical protein
MSRELLALEAVHQVHEAVVGGVDVRIVDLVRVAREHELGVVARARDTMVLTSWGVRFCASSTIMYWCGMERPRMYVSGSI